MTKNPLCNPQVNFLKAGHRDDVVSGLFDLTKVACLVTPDAAYPVTIVAG